MDTGPSQVPPVARATEQAAGTHAASGAGRGLVCLVAAAFGVCGVGAAAALGGLCGLIAYYATRPRGDWGSGEPPEGLAEDVTFVSAGDSTQIRGWFLPARLPTPGPAVVLCHGAGTGRRECLPWAVRFHAAGYSVLCFDFRAHGQSEGRCSSVGHNEAHDIIGAVRFLQTRAEVDPKRIGVVGFSMGAAATIRAAAECPEIAAVVADSSYASLVEAARHIFQQFGNLPAYPFVPLTLLWARWLVRTDPWLARPVDAIGRIAPRPILIIHGQDDEVIPVQHAYLLFKAANEPKELWVVPKARHVQARDLDSQEYFERVEGFLQSALSVPTRPINRLPKAA